MDRLAPIPASEPAKFIAGRPFGRTVGGISVEIHEPVNVLSTMLLAITFLLLLIGDQVSAANF